MNKKALIETLNSIGVGELTAVEARLDRARRTVRDAGHEEIAAILDAAASRLELADLKGFRKKIAHAVSRVGHVRQPGEAARTTRVPARLQSRRGR